MAKQTWIIVANSAKARFFCLVTKDHLEEMEGLVHSESRLRESELVSDRPGRAYDRMGGGRHALEGELDPHKRETSAFAAQVAQHLKASWDKGEFAKLYVAAGPTFLGFLRKHLAPQVRTALAGEIGKDMTQLTTQQIREHLPYIP